MAATPIILKTGGTSGPSSPGFGSNDLVAGEVITLSDTEPANSSASYVWEIEEWPLDAAMPTLLNPTTPTPSFTVDANASLDGSYRIKCIVDGVFSAIEVYAKPLTFLGTRNIGFQEQEEYDFAGNARGWMEAETRFRRAVDVFVGATSLDQSYDGFAGGGSGRVITADSGPVDIQVDNIALNEPPTADTTALLLSNNISALVGAQRQYSPALVFKGSVWDNDGVTDRDISAAIQLQGEPGNDPSVSIKIGTSIDGGSYFWGIEFIRQGSDEHVNFPSGSALVPGITVGGIDGFYRPSNGVIAVSTAQVEAVRWDASQNMILAGSMTVAAGGIVSTSAGNISITPDTTGDLILDGVKWPQADGASGQVMSTDGAGQLAYITLGDIELARISGSTFSTVQHLQDIFHSSGWVSGGSIIDDADGTITVAAGTGLIRDANGATETLLYFDWAEEFGANVNLTDNAINYIYAEYNAGSPRIFVDSSKRADTQTNVLLGTVFRIGTSLHRAESNKQEVGDHAANMVIRLTETTPFARVSGGSVDEVGTRNISVSLGIWWHGLTKFTTTAVNTSTGGTFTYAYQDGSGGFTEVASSTVIDNLQYDDGSGVLAALSNNRYGVHWVYVEQDSEYVVVYGRDSYTIGDATAAPVPANVPPRFQENHGRLIGRVIIQESSATFELIESVFDADFDSSVPTDHNSLLNLPAGDVHTQYLPLTGVRAMTGALELVVGTIGAPSINVGDVGTGFYRAAFNQIAIVTDGVTACRWNAAQQTITKVGTESSPGLIFGDAGSGLWRPGTDIVAISTGATEAVRWDASQNMTLAGVARAADGVISAPAWSFSSTPAMGFYAGAGLLHATVDGVNDIWNANNTVINFRVPPRPYADDTLDMGTVSRRWATVYQVNADIREDAIGTAETVGINMHNDTDAIVSLNQNSPMTVWEGQGWKTDATAATQEVLFSTQLETVQGTASPTGWLSIKSNVNGAGYNEVASFHTSGGIHLPNGVQAGPTLTFRNGGNTGLWLVSSTVFAATAGAKHCCSFSSPGKLLISAESATESDPQLAGVLDTDTGWLWDNSNALIGVTGATEAVRWDASQNQLNAGNISLGVNQRLILDDDDDTYIVAELDDVIRFYAAGAYVAGFNSAGLFMQGGKYISHFDGTASNLPIRTTTSGTGLFFSGATVATATGGIERQRWSANTTGLPVSTITRDAIGAPIISAFDLDEVGLSLTNVTDAAAGAQQFSPAFMQRGAGWKTNATASSQEMRLSQQLQPVEGAANPTMAYSFTASIENVNAGAFAEIARLEWDGTASEGAWRMPAGSFQNVAYGFIGSGATGMYSQSAGAVIAWSANGTRTMTMSSSGLFIDRPGSEAVPSLRIDGNSSGFYAPAANEVALSTLGTQAVLWDTSQNMTTAGQILGPTGTGSSGAYSFAASTNSGLGWSGSSKLTMDYAGLVRQQWLSVGGEFLVNDIADTDNSNWSFLNDTLATAPTPVQRAPSIRYRGRVWDTTTVASVTVKHTMQMVPVSGATADVRADLVFTAQDTGSQIETARLSSKGHWLMPSGSAGFPAYGFTAAAQLGMYKSAAGNNVVMVAGGSTIVSFGGLQIKTGSLGSESVPTYTQNNNLTTGLFFGTNILAVTTGATEAVRWDASQNQINAGSITVAAAGIISADTVNLSITPGTTGDLVLDGVNWPQADGAANQVLQTDGAGQLSYVTISAGGGTLDGAYDFGGAGAGRAIIADSGSVTITTDGIVTNKTPNFELINSTPATASVTQYSPMIVLEGQGWANTGSSSKSSQFALQNAVLEGTPDPTGLLAFRHSLNGAAYTTGGFVSPKAILLNNFGETTSTPSLQFAADSTKTAGLRRNATTLDVYLTTSVGNIVYIGVGATGTQWRVDTNFVGTPLTGSASNPAIIVGNDQGSGMWRVGVGVLAFSSSGSEALRLHSDQQVRIASAGTESLPAMIVGGDIDTGIWRPGTNTLAFSTGATEAVRWNANQQQEAIVGTQSLPSYTFAGRTDTGAWSSASGIYNISVGGAEIIKFTHTDLQLVMDAGSATKPKITMGDTGDNTGLYGGESNLSITIDGVQSVNFSAVSGKDQIRMGISTDLSVPNYAFDAAANWGMTFESSLLRMVVAGNNNMTFGASAVTVYENFEPDGDYTRNLGGGSKRWQTFLVGRISHTQKVQDSQTNAPAYTLTAAAHTNVVSMAGPDIHFDLGRIVTTTGAGTNPIWYGIQITAPTLAGTDPSTKTWTDAATLYIDNAPSEGVFAVIDNPYALFVDAGLCRFDGNGTDVFELPADATDPTSGGGAATGRIPVRIGGTTVYIPYY